MHQKILTVDDSRDWKCAKGKYSKITTWTQQKLFCSFHFTPITSKQLTGYDSITVKESGVWMVGRTRDGEKKKNHPGIIQEYLLPTEQ